MSELRVLTGVKPTGMPHLGNYLGAIKPAIDMAKVSAAFSMFFIADYHALTTMRDGKELRNATLSVAATWLALGLNTSRGALYRQSDIPEIFELSWVLSCMTPKGWMNRMHAYKAYASTSKEEQELGINIGTYTYSILMAADILVMDADIVPVGKDQIQHVEFARDLADRVNHVYKSHILNPPSASIRNGSETIPGTDGKKMSKSYGNIIPFLAPEKIVRKAVMSIVTDSTPPSEPKDPEKSTIFKIYEQLARPDLVAELRDRYQQGIGWGEAKSILADLLVDYFEIPRATYETLMDHPATIEGHLENGASKVRPIAREVLNRVRKAIGA